MTYQVLEGDCKDELKHIENNSIQLIMTSPPYADARRHTYGGIAPDKYVEWFLERSGEFMRVLKPSGTFILNIKEKVVNGERHTYVLELILALRKQGWLWTDEYIWHKKNAMPGKWSNRFRDGWERLLQFNKSRKFDMYQDEVRRPPTEWTQTRLKTLSEKDKVRRTSSTGSNFGKNLSNWVDRETVYPDNVLYLAGETRNKGHSAVYPITIPDFFIKLYSTGNDTVLDPFAGSGTTLVSALNHGRTAIGVEILPDNVRLIHERISKEFVNKLI